MTQAPLSGPGSGVSVGSVGAGVTLGVVTALTLVGNLLVVGAVCSARKLRTVSNLFIVSLSLADLLVGTVVMVPATLSELCQRWVLGPDFCPVWASFDVMLCSASVLNVCLISFDRYLSIMTPLRYTTLMTGRRAALLLVAAWSVAVASSFVPITNGWHNPSRNSLLNLTLAGPRPQCVLRVSLPYALTASFVTILLPILIALTLYCRVSEEAKRQAIFVRSLMAPSRVLLGADLSASSLREPFTRKATVTLGVIVGAYVVTWTPFLVTNTVDAWCRCVPPRIFGGVVWLGYCNSLVNPIIYPLLMRDFRKVYLEQLRACCPASALTFIRKAAKHTGVKDTGCNLAVEEGSGKSSVCGDPTPANPSPHSQQCPTPPACPDTPPSPSSLYVPLPCKGHCSSPSSLLYTAYSPPATSNSFSHFDCDSTRPFHRPINHEFPSSPPHNGPSPPLHNITPPQNGPSPPPHSNTPPHNGPSPPPHSITPPQNGPSPPPHSITPPHNGPSPPPHSITPPHNGPSPPPHSITPPQNGPSPPPHSYTPPQNGPSPPPHSITPPHNGPSPPPHSITPPQNGPSPPPHSITPPHNGPSPPPHSNTPPHNGPSPPPHSITPPHNGPSPPPHSNTPPHNGPSPPPHSITPPHNVPSPPPHSITPPQNVPSPPPHSITPPQNSLCSFCRDPDSLKRPDV